MREAPGDRKTDLDLVVFAARRGRRERDGVPVLSVQAQLADERQGGDDSRPPGIALRLLDRPQLGAVQFEFAPDVVGRFLARVREDLGRQGRVESVPEDLERDQHAREGVLAGLRKRVSWPPSLSKYRHAKVRTIERTAFPAVKTNPCGSKQAM